MLYSFEYVFLLTSGQWIILTTPAQASENLSIAEVRYATEKEVLSAMCVAPDRLQQTIGHSMLKVGRLFEDMCGLVAFCTKVKSVLHQIDRSREPDDSDCCGG